jgi:general secretion pathway protein J
LTLVELLVGLAVLGLIAAALAGALRTGIAGRDAVEGRAERLNELRLGQAFIRRHLTQARPVKWAEGRRARVAFEGDGEGVSFVSVMPSWPSAGGLYLVRLALAGDRLVLLRRITAGEADGFAWDGETERWVLASGVASLRFAYFGAETRRDPPRWRDDWRDRTDLPLLVRLDVAYAEPSSGRWPTLVVAPVLGAQPR